MNKKIFIGLIGLIVGGLWLANNYRYFDEQGVLAIGMPLVITLLGLNYLIKGLRGDR